MFIPTLKNLFKAKEKGQSKLYKDFMLWQIHGCGSDVLISGLRPEYEKYVKQAKKQAGKDASEEQVLAALEIILEKL